VMLIEAKPSGNGRDPNGVVAILMDDLKKDAEFRAVTYLSGALCSRQLHVFPIILGGELYVR